MNNGLVGSSLPDTKTNLHYHPLYGINGGPYRCDRCGGNFTMSPSFRYSCTLCSFDICPNCWRSC